MTPAARIAVAIDILDQVLTGESAEQVLTNWGRSNRFAGSKDRAAIRDLVFDGLRCKRSYAALGGAMTGRGIMIGALRAADTDPATVFTGEGYAPAALSADEAGYQPPELSDGERLDAPEWLLDDLRASLGDNLDPVMDALRHRAPVFLRVNLRKGTVNDALRSLARDEITAEPCDLSPSALRVTGNPRRVQNSAAYQIGLVELQDAASQAVVDLLPLVDDLRVLDYCAGGGGKTLAMAGRVAARFYAYDSAPRRLAPLADRAARAGVDVALMPDRAAVTKSAPYDVVLCDVPCSGSGAWRRSPQGKWALTRADLDGLLGTQAGIMDEVADLVRAGGTLAYATCSMLNVENGDQVRAFMDRHPGAWRLVQDRAFTPLDGGDGFYVAILTKN